MNDIVSMRKMRPLGLELSSTQAAPEAERGAVATAVKPLVATFLSAA
jgi:hypothetical protein